MICWKPKPIFPLQAPAHTADNAEDKITADNAL